MQQSLNMYLTCLSGHKPEHHQTSAAQIQRFVAFLDRMFGEPGKLSHNSTRVCRKLWWDLTACLSVWRIPNAISSSMLRLQIQPWICDPCYESLIHLCHCSLRPWLSSPNEFLISQMLLLDVCPDFFFFTFQVPALVCHPTNAKQTVTDMTTSSANRIIFADGVWHDPGPNDLEFKLFQ